MAHDKTAGHLVREVARLMRPGEFVPHNLLVFYDPADHATLEVHDFGPSPGEQQTIIYLPRDRSEEGVTL